MKAKRGDLSGPVLAILVTLVMLAIGAAIIAYFVLLGGAPQQAVIAVVGQPIIVRGTGSDDFQARMVIKNVGSTSITLSSSNIRLRIATSEQTAASLSTTSLSPGGTATVVFNFGTGWSSIIGDRETIRGALTIEGVGTLEVVFRVIRPS